MKNAKLLVEYVRKKVQAHWLLIHALVAPWGTVIATGILVNLDRSAPEAWTFWRYWGDIGAMSSAVSYGAAVYGCAVSGTEVTVRMAFYAIAKILEYQEKRKEERQQKAKERERQLNEAVSVARRETRRETRREVRQESIDLVLNNPELQQYPELQGRIVKDLEEAMEEGEREDTTDG